MRDRTLARRHLALRTICTASPSRSKWARRIPATHGTVRISLKLDGERIVNADVQVGYLHRGFEKECESGFYYQAIPYTDRLNYAAR